MGKSPREDDFCYSHGNIGRYFANQRKRWINALIFKSSAVTCWTSDLAAAVNISSVTRDASEASTPNPTPGKIYALFA